MNENLFVALREAFPADLDGIAIETADGPALRYTWRDLDRATAMIANLFGSLGLPKGARIVATAVVEERIVITLDIGGATEIRTFDLHTLRQTGRLRFATEP